MSTAIASSKDRCHGSYPSSCADAKCLLSLKGVRSDGEMGGPHLNIDLTGKVQYGHL